MTDRSTPITLAELAHLVDRDVATIHRWARKGCKGVKLGTTFVGGIRHTSLQAFDQFNAAIKTMVDGPGPAPSRPNPKRARVRHAAAERALDKAGV